MSPMLTVENMDYTYTTGPNHVDQRDVDVLWNLP
jgi:hypothetical protein